MSVYLPELDALFVHCPKTGGTWVKAALEASGIRCEPAKGPGNHNLPASYRRAGRRFCFVRKPWTWIESAWRGLHSGWPNRREVAPLHRERSWSPIRMLTYTAGDRDFNGFIETLLATQRGFVSRMFEWYAGPPGYPLVDYVGQQEHLRDHLERILRALGWSGQLTNLAPENVGPQVPIEWEPALRVKFDACERPAMNRWYGNDDIARVTTNDGAAIRAGEMASPAILTGS